jgi:DNA-binding transcriptional LysR family regulator
VPEFYPALAVVAATDLVAFASTAIVGTGRISGLGAVPPPFPLPPIEIAQTWHPRHTHDHRHERLRATVRQGLRACADRCHRGAVTTAAVEEPDQCRSTTRTMSSRS